MYGSVQIAVIEPPGLRRRKRPVPRYCWHRPALGSAGRLQVVTNVCCSWCWTHAPDPLTSSTRRVRVTASHGCCR